jgi:hypothetical protein
MTVTMAEFDRLDPASAGLHGVVNGVGSHLGERRVTVLLPDLVQPLEPRG